MNTNKLKAPRNRLDETVVELKTDLSTAIDRLRQLSGLCRSRSATDRPVYFESNKRGRFSVVEIGTRHEPSTATVAVKGGLYTEDGKTKAVVYAYRIGGSATAVFVVAQVLLTPLMVLGWYLSLQEEFIPAYAVAAVVALAIQVVHLAHYLSRRNQSRSNRDEDAGRFKVAALERLSAVDEWDK